MPFTFKKLNIPDVMLVESKVFPDTRGYFLESFKESYEHKIKTGISIFKKNQIKK